MNKDLYRSAEFQGRAWYQGCGGHVDERLLLQLEKDRSFVAEPKRDGIWVAAFGDTSGVKFWSRTQTPKRYSLETVTALAGATLVGELGFGSQTAVARRTAFGHDFMDVFDVLTLDYDDAIAREPGNVRRRELTRYLAAQPLAVRRQFRLVPRWRALFDHRYAAEPEGLVLKHVEADRGYIGGGTKVDYWVKCKRSRTADMVILDWEQSTAVTKVFDGVPRVEKLSCGAYVNGALTPLVKVGAMTDELSRAIAADFERYRGRVVEVKHFGQFKSGSLRHPSLVRLRDDKRPEECVFNPAETETI